MRRNRRSSVVAVLVLWIMVATAQDYTVSRHFNVASGLTNDFVVELAIDGQGFLWVATEAGVSRVAGNTCQEIKVADIRPVMTSALYHQPSNQVLLGSEKGLSIYDCQRHRLWQATKELGFHPVNVEALCAAHDGGVWIAYGTGHVQYWKGDESKPIDIPIAERFSCHSAMDDGRGHLYLGHWTGGMSIVHPSDGTTERFTHQPDDTSSIPGNNVRSITQDSQGRVWVGTDHGLALFHPDTKTFTKVKREDDSYDDNVYDIREMSDGNLWVATDLGGIRIVCLRQVTNQDDELCYQPADIRLSSINTRCIQQDAFNNIWVGNHSTGVDFISAQRRQFHLINYLGPSGLPKPVYAMADDDDRQCWIGSEDELTLWHD